MGCKLKSRLRAGRGIGLAVLSAALAGAPSALAAPPANDNYDSAESISGTSAITVGDTREATREADEPDHNGAEGTGSVWYKIAPGVDRVVEIDVCDKDYPSAIAIYQDDLLEEDGLDALTYVASDTCVIAFRAFANSGYRVAVDGQQGDRGRFTLRMESWPAPANDGVNSPASLSGATANVGADLRGASVDPGEAGPTLGFPASVWYSWTAPATGTVDLKLCEGGFEGAVGVYAVTGGGGLGALINYNYCRVVTEVTAGTAYRIAVRGERRTFNFTLKAYPKPGNDDFGNAELLTGATVAVAGDTRGATSPTGLPNETPGSVWYTWVSPVQGAVEIDVCSEFFNFVVLYTGSTQATLSPVASPIGCRLRAPVQSGTTYKIRVASSSLTGADTFDLQLRATAKPANDDFASAQPVTSTDTVVTGDIRGATREAVPAPGEPGHETFPQTTDGSVWYRWTSTVTGRLRFDACGPDGVTEETSLDVAAYTSTAPATPAFSNLVLSARALCVISIRVTSGTTYWLAVQGNFGSGPFAARLRAAVTQANDDFAGATTISPGQSIGGNTTTATYEMGEPGAGSPLLDGGSLWYKVTPSQEGQLSVSTCFPSTTYDSTLGIYQGSDVSNLTELAFNDDGAGACGAASQTAIHVLAAQTYWIAVAGDMTNANEAQQRGLFLLSATLVDDIQPETTISTTEPASVVTVRTQAVAFTSSEAGTFQCSLDSDEETDFSVCTSSKTYTGLGDGEHVIRVRAIDTAGNVDESPAEFHLEVDATPPETTILDGPPSPTNDATPTFRYISSESQSTLPVQDRQRVVQRLQRRGPRWRGRRRVHRPRARGRVPRVRGEGDRCPRKPGCDRRLPDLRRGRRAAGDLDRRRPHRPGRPDADDPLLVFGGRLHLHLQDRRRA